MLALVNQHFIHYCHNQSILYGNAGPGKSTFYPPLSQSLHSSWQCWTCYVNILSAIVTISASFMTMLDLVSHHFSSIFTFSASFMTMLDLESQHFTAIVTMSASFMAIVDPVSQHFIRHCHNQSILHDNVGPGKPTFYPLLSQLVHPSWQCWTW